MTALRTAGGVFLVVLTAALTGRGSELEAQEAAPCEIRPPAGFDLASTAQARPETHAGNLLLPGVVLLEVHTSNMEDRADTLATVICSGRLRRLYGGGHSILDTTTDRFILLDPATATYRSIPLSEWEEQVRQSPTGEPTSRDTLRFEPMGGEPASIAGYPCARYHLYARREVFPGEFETVEEEIWVTRELALSVSASRTYARVQASLDWIGLDAPVVRPEGVALRTSVRRHPQGEGSQSDELEAYEVIAVQDGDVPAAWFQIPEGFVRAEGGAGGDQPDEDPGP